MQKCGECDLCCKLLEIHDIPSKIGEYCQYCNKGCTIRDTRPKECSTYQCMWSQMENVGNELRPDQCGIIFDRITDDVITARLEENKLMNPLVHNQVNNFIEEGFSVLIFRGKDMKYFLNDNHTKEYVLGAINDSS